MKKKTSTIEMLTRKITNIQKGKQGQTFTVHKKKICSENRKICEI